jgi:hypothetical protein
VGLRDVLFGKSKLSEPKEDRLFALTTAAVTLETSLGLKTAGAAAIAFKPQSSGEFRSAFDDVDELVDAVAKQCGSKIERKTDDYGYDWVIVHDDDLEDLVGAAHTLSSELTAKGFGSQLLAAIFRFDGFEHPVYWIYGFKRGAWWPFVPTGDAKRDNAKELELKSQLEDELPVEQDLTRWLALFDAPI